MKKKLKLDGLEVASFIKDRQAHTVRQMKQSQGITSKLAIVRSAGNPTIDVYLKVKQAYAEEIGVGIDVHITDTSSVSDVLDTLSKDASIHGVIMQLPFAGLEDIDKVALHILPSKDVDNLRKNSPYDAPTATAILWLLAAYNVQLEGKNIVVVGNGRLVGEPLVKMLHASGIEATVVDENTPEPERSIGEAELLITGVGKPEIISSKSIQPGTIVIDAGVASDGGVLKGDVEESARVREDISITPRIGGVGPLTVAALFENVLRASIKGKT
jgi:methylenetetrahydrofolate dehydrogenase (NADP+)/methenyltetrahydrofolate cyclohydrolase